MRTPGATRRLSSICTLLIVVGAATRATAQNPFAPAPTPSATAPAAPAPSAPAPAANPFAAPAPAASAPAAPAPAMPAANPFGAPAAAPANPFGAPAPAAGTPAAPAPGAAAPAMPAIALPPISLPTSPPSGSFRTLAKGVMITIPSPVGVDDTESRHDIVEVLAGSPNYGVRPAVPERAPAKNVLFKHNVWGLDFSFKPVRFIRLPQPDGTTRLIWYMIYSVNNKKDQPFLFIPSFELESHDADPTGKKLIYKATIIPDAVVAIQNREDKNRKLLNTGEMTGLVPAHPGDEFDHSVWGVVTWEGVDPRTDKFSVYVHGLTNAYRWQDAPADSPEAFKAGDPVGKGKTYQYQVLKLNFWRPGDTRFQHEEEIRYGLPGELDHTWFYK